MSDLQGRRIPGEEDSGRRRPWFWIVLGLLLLLLLAVLIPFACQSLGGGGQDGGSGAQGGAEQNADDNNADEGSQGGEAQGNDAQTGGTQAGGDSGEGGEGTEDQEVVEVQLSARDQSGDGEAVTVPAATIEGTRGWLAVQADDGGEPGEVLGYAPLKEGENRDVEVELRRPLDASSELYATVHAERPADGDFTYPDGDPTAEGGGTAVEPISYTVDETDDDAAQGGIRDDELPESGGVPAGALLAIGAGLLAAGAWALRTTLR